MAAAGAVIHLFPTGQGNIVERTINGRLTCAESLGHREFVLTKLYPSA